MHPNRLILGILIIGAFTSQPCSAQTRPASPAPDQPFERQDNNSQLAHQQLLLKAKTGHIDIYFEGDSITRRWGATDDAYKSFLANWKNNFFGWNAADFGWGGDTTQNIIWRLDNGELDNVNPKIIVLMAGTNNVGNITPRADVDDRAKSIAAGIKKILELCQDKAPNATIILMAITPRNDNMAVMPLIDKINTIIATYADGKKIRFVNINDKVADSDGKLLEGMTGSDHLHLQLKAYQIWANAMKPIFTEILGPPGKEDSAPPPTGDPSAAPKAATSPDITATLIPNTDHLEIRYDSKSGSTNPSTLPE